MNLTRIKAHADEYTQSNINHLEGVRVEEIGSDEDSIVFADSRTYYLLMPDLSKCAGRKVTMQKSGDLFEKSEFQILSVGKVTGSFFTGIALRSTDQSGELVWFLNNVDVFDVPIHFHLLDRAWVDMGSNSGQEAEYESDDSDDSESDSAPFHGSDDAARMEFLDRAAIAFMQGSVGNMDVSAGAGRAGLIRDIADDAYTVAQAMWDARQALFFKGES